MKVLELARRLCGDDERPAATSQARRQRFPNSDPLHCHRVFADVQAQASAHQPAAAWDAEGWRANPSAFVMSSSTLNGMEPLALSVSQPGYVLRRGEVVQSRTAAEISNNPNLSISYLGT